LKVGIKPDVLINFLTERTSQRLASGRFISKKMGCKKSNFKCYNMGMALIYFPNETNYSEDFMRSNVFFLTLWSIVLMLFFTGCDTGNRNVTSQERAVVEFNGIALVGVGNVNVHPGENYKVIVTTDSNLQDRVLTTIINGNTLQISQSSGSFNATELTIEVFMPELKSISLNGAGNFKINDGNSSALNFSLSGTGNIDAQNFQVQDVTITHSGVGNARVWATNSLNGTLSGVGNIFYKGDPAINVNRTGIGNISRL
jgi:hypothetical protein